MYVRVLLVVHACMCAGQVGVRCACMQRHAEGRKEEQNNVVCVCYYGLLGALWCLLYAYYNYDMSAPPKTNPVVVALEPLITCYYCTEALAQRLNNKWQRENTGKKYGVV